MENRCYGLSWWLRGKKKKNPPANVGNTGSILGSGRCPGEGNGDPLQYSFLFLFFHSSILAWEIPQTETPGGLQFMGSPKS